jgi:hypothetical protein
MNGLVLAALHEFTTTSYPRFIESWNLARFLYQSHTVL